MEMEMDEEELIEHRRKKAKIQEMYRGDFD